jgi:arabinose-5-phosphate isomerase
LNLAKNIKKIAQDVLINESTAIQNLIHLIDDSFKACVQEIYSAKGCVVTTGFGKSAIIANKIVATHKAIIV